MDYAIQAVGGFRFGQPRLLRHALCDFRLFHAGSLIAADLAVTARDGPREPVSFCNESEFRQQKTVEIAYNEMN